MLAAGERVKEFETLFAGYCGTNHAVAVSNGTTALHAALLAAGIGPGDEVIVPSFSFIATATAVSMCGATPVFADVDENLFTIDPSSAAQRVTGKTKAIIGVHLFGQPFDIGGVQKVCDAHDLTLIEDAAQAHGALYHGKKVGGFGQSACFSFYATKNMITGEGGMITSNDAACDKELRLIVNHGQSEKYLHTRLGYNYRMTDIAAAIGIVQLNRLDGFNNARRKNAEYYDSHLSVNGLVTPEVATGMYHVYHQYVIRLNEDFPMDRKEFMAFLHQNGIGSAIHYPIPIHHQPLYAKSNETDLCPVSTALASSVLSLPVHPLVEPQQLAYICDTINGVR
jgi:perosamine synthetase